MENQRTAKNNQSKPKENLRCPGLFLGAEGVKECAGAEGWGVLLTRGLRAAYAYLRTDRGTRQAPGAPTVCSLCVLPLYFPLWKYLTYAPAAAEVKRPQAHQT